MTELTNERVLQILHEETKKTEELETILRSIYLRYMRLYEKYFADIDALDDDKIAEMKKYHEETTSLIKIYYMDIPQDVCLDIKKFDDDYNSKLLGSDWHKYLYDKYDEFKSEKEDEKKSEECLKAEFKEQSLADFYKFMEEIFRGGFGTSSKTVENVAKGISGLLFGK